MSLIYVVGILLLVALLLWGISRLPFLDATMVQVIRVVVIVIVGLWLIGLFFGVDLASVRIGHSR